jgi:ribose/xylose/arabinose/galactoside ABC-type transport system permease subunit
MKEAEMPTEQTPLEMIEDVVDLSVGAVTALMPALLLAIPGVVLLLPLLIPLVAGALIMGIVGAIAAVPFLLVRAVRRSRVPSM